MNTDIMEGNWKVLKGHVQEKWGKLTNDALDEIEGNRQKLAGHIQKAYGHSKEEAEKEVEEWEKDYKKRNSDRAA
ncbi:MAG: CsbD family protein [Alphaproteobacteria bacterium]|nr:CsbD family protein [Alphaproteobacteria bacterium]